MTRLTPVLGSLVVLHWLTPALAVALSAGFLDSVSPVGTWVWSALVWSIRSSAPYPGVAAAGVGSAWLAPTSRA